MKKVAIIGGGQLAEAMVAGLIKSGYDPQLIWVTNRQVVRQQYFNDTYGVRAGTANVDALAWCDMVALAVKPYQVKDVCMDIASHVGDKPLISLAAGINLDALQGWLTAKAQVFRAMPNVAMRVQQGVVAFCATERVGLVTREEVQQLFSRVGHVVWLDDESHFSVVTAISGSGPAYYFLLSESLIEAAQALGLSYSLAKQLVNQTAYGSIEVARESNVDWNLLRQQVTSPNGTTDAAISWLSKSHFSEIILSAVKAAASRAEELHLDIDTQ